MPDTLLSPTASLTVALLAQNVIKSLGDVPFEDSHSNAPTNSGTSLTIATGGADRYEVGDVLEWRADGTNDIARVTAVADTALTISRGFFFSTAAAHLANAVFVKWPRFWAQNVAKAVQDSLDQDLYPELFAVYETDVTPDTTKVWYSIAVGAEDILDAYQKTTSTPTELIPVHIGDPTYVDTAISSTNKAVRITIPDSTQTVYVRYLVQPAVGDLSAGMGRVVEYGACRRLLEWKAAEITGRPDIQQSGTMVPGIITRDAAFYSALQDQAKRKEKAVLDRRFPRRRRRWLADLGYGRKHVPDVFVR